MRRLWCTLIVCLALGCRSQSMPMSNPFMAPDRVPPPATRTLLPGTAQPYYPGDPVPNSPAIGVPVTPPATNFGPAPTYAPPATTPTTPPGGWSTGPVSSTAPTSSWPNGVQQASAQVPVGSAAHESIQVPTDNEALRFGDTTQSQIAQASYEAPVAPSQPDQFAGIQTPIAPAQQVAENPATMQRDVSIREISSAQLANYESDSPSAPPRVAKDGFRPQGSTQLRDEEPVRPQLSEPSKSITPTPEPVVSYSYDPQYRWLRGQLLLNPTTGQWHLQYIAPGGVADSLGGSLPITNPQVLGAMQPGELVSVEGRLEMLQLDAMSVVPAYTVTVLQRQQQAIR